MRRTIRQQIDGNRRASYFYIFLLMLLLAALGSALVGYYAPDYWVYGGLGASLIGLVLGMISLAKGPDIVLSISQAREVSPLELRRLDNVTEEMALAAGIPTPHVYVIDDSAPNAFATGNSPKRGVVVVTTGLLDKLNRDELQGVVAHEIGHIRNNDIQLMTTLAIVAGLIPLMADFLGRSIFWGGGRRRDRDDNGIFVIIGLILAIVAPIFAKLLELAVSRQREYLADATAAELTRYPEGLANALQRIAADTEPLEAANRATQHMYIINPLRHSGQALLGLFSTHPPTDERIRRLRSLAGMPDTPYIRS
ncbi:MAG: Protease HtpX [Fimbriimonadaceae bacterium]|nr:Protease HtpX [Fimbriimonadaceae bacterium]